MQDPLTRRAFVSAGVGASVVGFAAVVAGCGSSSSSAAAAKPVRAKRSLTKLTLQLSWLPSVEWAGTYLAKARGYHAAEGLDVTILPGGPQVTVEPLIATGKVQIGMTYGIGTATANKNGAKLRIFGGDLQKNPDGIASLASAPIRTPAELEGTRLGVSTTGLLSMKSFLKAAGVDVSKIKFVPVQSSLEPLAARQVDAFGCFLPETATLEVKSIKTSFMFRADFGAVDVEDAYGATTSTIASMGDELSRFMRAQRRGWHDFVADPAGAAALVVQQYGSGAGLSLTEQKIEAHDYASLVTGPATRQDGLLALSPATRAGAIKAISEAGIGHYAISDVFDQSVLTAAGSTSGTATS